MRVDVPNIKNAKLIITTLCLVVICNFAFAQKRLPQNVRRVIVTVEYPVIDGRYKMNESVVKQEIFDSLGRCHSEIDWSPVDHYPMITAGTHLMEN